MAKKLPKSPPPSRTARANKKLGEKKAAKAAKAAQAGLATKALKRLLKSEATPPSRESTDLAHPATAPAQTRLSRAGHDAFSSVLQAHQERSVPFGNSLSSHLIVSDNPKLRTALAELVDKGLLASDPGMHGFYSVTTEGQDYATALEAGSIDRPAAPLLDAAKQLLPTTFDLAPSGDVAFGL